MYTENYITKTLQNQDIKILSDLDNEGKERPWAEKKTKTIPLFESYVRLGLTSKAFRVKECGTYLEYKRYLSDDALKLHSANFCKVRLCPMCAWRRSKKIYAQVSMVMDQVTKDKDYSFLFLTLTVKNIEGEELSSTIDKLFYAYKKLMLKSKVKKSVKGWFRALEVTHNLEVGSENFDTYHPHFHVILMVNKSYFKDTKYYISQDEWTDYWKGCLEVDYTPIVHVTKIKTKTDKDISKCVSEVATYTAKDKDYIIPESEDLTDSAVSILDFALANRRLIAFGGELRKVHKALKLDDLENGNLVNTGEDDEIREDLEYIIETYFWNVGYNQYIRAK